MWMTLFNNLAAMCLLVVGSIGCLQAGDAEAVTETTLCALYESPARYAGNFVRVRARVIGVDLKDLGIDDVSACSAPTAYMFMLAELPDNVRPKPSFSLEPNASFSEFRDALHKHVALLATLEGRFDPVFVWKERSTSELGRATALERSTATTAGLSYGRSLTWRPSSSHTGETQLQTGYRVSFEK